MSGKPLRVPVETTAARDPRFAKLGRIIGGTKWDAFGRVEAVWMLCNERRAEEVSLEDADIVAEWDGFGRAMVTAGLADLASEESIYVRGMAERAAFLHRQVENGRRSGESRRRDPIARRITTNAQTSLELQGRTYVPGVVQPGEEQVFNGVVDYQRTRNGNQVTKVEHVFPGALNQPGNPQDLDLSTLQGSGSGISGLSASNGHDLDIQLRGSKRTSDVQNAESSRNARVADPSETTGDASFVQPRATGEASDSRVGRPRSAIEAPQEALIAAHQLIDYICTNNPASKVARMSDASRNALALRWADEIRRLHEIDRIPWAGIQTMIHWSQRHTFWRANVLSAEGLRRNWDKMVAQKNRPREVHPNAPSQRKGTLEHAREAIDRLDAADAALGSSSDGVPSDDLDEERAL